MSVEVKNARILYGDLKDYCDMSDDLDYIEAVEWQDYDGFDIHICRKKGSDRFSLTHGELALISVLMIFKGGEQ